MVTTGPGQAEKREDFSNFMLFFRISGKSEGG
jgi:hypothetical protein